MIDTDTMHSSSVYDGTQHLLLLLLDHLTQCVSLGEGALLLLYAVLEYPVSVDYSLPQLFHLSEHALLAHLMLRLYRKDPSLGFTQQLCNIVIW